jgi:hypothetical protein
MTPAAVDTGLLLELVWAAAIAGIAVCLSFALVILGATRAADMRRDGRGLAASAYGLLGTAAFVAVVGGIAFGVSVIATK